MVNPLVSICCISYNQEPFIRTCLEGFLSQRTSFAFEILIHDDCSTDGTTDIIKEYELKYPNLIFPLYEEENQYSRGKASVIDFYNYKRARGKYIAYCEGDDYWTDPLKLQKQVDFMESHPDYVICFHLAPIFETETGVTRPLHVDFPGGLDVDIDVTPELFLHTAVGQPLSMVFRKDIYSYEWQKHYTDYCDTAEIFHILLEGKGRFMKFVGGQYNLQNGGVSATMSDMNRSLKSFRLFSEMFIYTSEPCLQETLMKSALWCEELSAIHGHYWDYFILLCRLFFRKPKLA